MAIIKYDIIPENLYNLDEIGYLIGFTQSCRVFYGKYLQRRSEALRACDRGREMVTVIETICADRSQLLRMIIFKGRWGSRKLGGKHTSLYARWGLGWIFRKWMDGWEKESLLP